MDQQMTKSTDSDTSRTLERQNLSFVDKFGFFSDFKRVCEFGTLFSFDSSQSQHNNRFQLNHQNEISNVVNILQAISSLKEFSGTASYEKSTGNSQVPHFKEQFEFMQVVAHQLNLQIKIYAVFANKLTCRKIGKRGFPKLLLFMSSNEEFTLLLKINSDFQESNTKCNSGVLSCQSNGDHGKSRKKKEVSKVFKFKFGEEEIGDHRIKSQTQTEFSKTKKEFFRFEQKHFSVSEDTTENSSGELKESSTSCFGRD